MLGKLALAVDSPSRAELKSNLLVARWRPVRVHGAASCVTGSRLIRTMPGRDMIDRVRAAAASVPGVVGIDKSRARKTGFKYHVDQHIETGKNPIGDA
jgi:hypothetical protein